ncbi:ProQ/FINO family protein [Pectobacterium aroidearum]|uniref:ProQ/FINO family protein n=1 Tax=Pectobacterium aroidearum TaxID=1201031 RepID=UPI002114CA87|nr:ProQ/FinO family protein [Pectobacterium aroidearum]UUE44930.1 ProQ/FinO family protein [Pectobacterium aroidearum]UUE49149.1 ProQ/FinO family protein [Pectobacterium aroidearum]UUE53353.1 ProQ/FinO family protein [Pectobacterium aroidearum]UUE61764.1 ProQ/FinO family protein [Pectobacterium aroidearum]UUE65988.1 ProQ/FinO family protein [Pectobacterium aroidearum]
MTENTRTVLRLKRATVSKATPPGHVTAETSRATEKTGNKQNRKNRKKLERLVLLWPDAFNLENPRPLAIGIDKALAADIERRQLSGAGSLRFSLGLYVHRSAYVKALAAGGQRYDLHGKPQGDVTAEQQERARAQRKQKTALRTEDAKCA